MNLFVAAAVQAEIGDLVGVSAFVGPQKEAVDAVYPLDHLAVENVPFVKDAAVDLVHHCQIADCLGNGHHVIEIVVDEGVLPEIDPDSEVSVYQAVEILTAG